MKAETIANALSWRKAGTGRTTHCPAFDNRPARITRSPGRRKRGGATVTATDIPAAHRAALVLGSEGRLCFPCRTNKRPTTPRGFKEATCDPSGLGDLWRRHPGPIEPDQKRRRPAP
jgi:hypothetical protein